MRTKHRQGGVPKVAELSEFAAQLADAKISAERLFGNVSEVTRRQQYRSYSSSITLTQPLFDYEAYARYKAGVAQTMMSDERYRGKLLILRLG